VKKDSRLKIRHLDNFAGIRRSHFMRIFLGFWFLVEHLFFKTLLCPTSFRPQLLRLCGASIGRGVLIRRGVRIHFPWNLSIGDNCWIGEEVWFINHEKVTIGSDVCISQRSIICSGGHDYRSASLEYAHKPVTIKDGAWVCLDAKVLPGVSIGECSVVSAGEIARKSLPDFSMLVGGQVRPIDPPK
jgi:putative colanic acid biosynthesis acetyltransferase WcaF